MKYYLSLVLLLGSLSLQAEIYRWTDEEGTVHFSDTEHPDAELIPTPTPNAIQMPKFEAKQPIVEEEKEEASSYNSFTIVSPADDSTITDNTGNLSVSLSIEPVLNIKSGHYIRLSVDNQIMVSKTYSLNSQISSINRGSHTLKAEVLNSSGQLLMSHSSRFHMKRFSIQH
ncbi:MAG: DUF4124 domain-containing protein [Gammaproteobacteria bacterium]|nr:DUF4124 domain-containing protein [Gammaproteobacteria bacterium]